MSPLSIIIPCFNCADTLEEAVNSCFEQGLQKFEIVLVDDKSTDSTIAVMRKLADLHSEITLFYHEKNKGGGATRNTAVQHSSFENIFCLDSDDLLPPQTLSLMLNFMEEKKCDAVAIEKSLKFAGTDHTIIKRIDTFGYSGEKIPFESLLQKNGVLCPLYSTFMHTKQAFEKAGGYPTDHGFDTQGFAWRFLAAGLSAYTCPNATYLHRIEFKDTYYVREAQAGKVNYNWQDIFMEHFAFFDLETQHMIEHFNCADFTQNLFDEVRKREKVFRDDYSSLFGTQPQPNTKRGKKTYITQNSFQGIYLRLKKKAVRYTDLGIEIGNGRKWQINLLSALFFLKLKKIIRIDFETQVEKSEAVDLVVPTIAKDFDLLSRSIESVKQNLCHQINKIYIVSSSTEEIKYFCQKNNYIFIDETSLFGYEPKDITYQTQSKNRSGWIFQQLIKLSGDTFVEKKNYLIVDSDTILIRPHVFIQNGKYVFFQSEEYHQPYFKTFKKIFGYSVKSNLSLTSHMMIFNTDFLKEIKKELEERHHMSWDKVYLSTIDPNELSCISDYDTYANWVHIHHPDQVIFTPLYNISLPRSELSALKNLTDTYSKKYKSLSFHHYHQ